MGDRKQTDLEPEPEDLEVEREHAEDVKGGNKQQANIKSQQQVRNAQRELEDFR